MARARTHPVFWEVLQRGIVDRSYAVRIEDLPATHKRPPSEFVDLPFGYVVAISFEEHPAGMCLHVSVSGPWPKVAPNMVVCAMIFNAIDVPAEADHVWTEEFLIDGKPGGRAFNVVWLVGRAMPSRLLAGHGAPHAEASATRRCPMPKALPLNAPHTVLALCAAPSVENACPLGERLAFTGSRNSTTTAASWRCRRSAVKSRY